jgi:hypothetical protein
VDLVCYQGTVGTKGIDIFLIEAEVRFHQVFLPRSGRKGTHGTLISPSYPEIFFTAVPAYPERRKESGALHRFLSVWKAFP